MPPSAALANHQIRLATRPVGMTGYFGLMNVGPAQCDWVVKGLCFATIAIK